VIAEEYIKNKLVRLKRSAAVVDAWQEILPGEFQEHCKLAGISGKTLEIEAGPGPFLHELQIMKTEILEQLQRLCPQAGITKIIVRLSRSKGMASNQDDTKNRS